MKNSMGIPQKVRATISSSNSTPGYLYEVNNYSVNNRVSKYTKRKLIKVKEEIDKSTIIISDFNTVFQWLLLIIVTQVDSKDTGDSNNTIRQLDLFNICVTFHSRSEDNTLFSDALRIFIKIVYMLNPKRSINKYKRINIMKCFLWLQIELTEDQ